MIHESTNTNIKLQIVLPNILFKYLKLEKIDAKSKNKIIDFSNKIIDKIIDLKNKLIEISVLVDELKLFIEKLEK